MNVEELRVYCLSKPAAEESFPFDEETLVFKVMGKMFALMPLESLTPAISLKCDPARAAELREQFPAVQPAYHMNKQHWNTLMADGSLSDALIRQLIDHSYQLIVNKLPKIQQEKLNLK